jgi:adenylate cyclase
MGLEIERKFLVADPAVVAGREGVALRQGYLCRSEQGVVRVRIAGDEAFLTVKSRTVDAVREEYEYPVPVADAESMLALCGDLVVAKVRHRIPHAGLVWEVDVFGGANRGLLLAECELETRDQEVSMPPWVGPEVTGDERYHNSSLAVRPFASW